MAHPTTATDSTPLRALSIIVAALALSSLASQREEPQAAPAVHQLTTAETPRFTSALEALRDGRGLDLNRASREELELIPGIGPTMSDRLVRGRPYASVEDIVRISGIGNRTLERLRPLLRVGGDENEIQED